jgi:type III secretion protein R
MNGIDPVVLVVVAVGLTLLPMAAVMTTSFLKIAVVLALLRNALGIQQIPPNTALYGLALILSVYVMAPVWMQITDQVQESTQAIAQGAPAGEQMSNIANAVVHGAEPLRAFMVRVSRPENRDFFLHTAKRLWGEEQAKSLKPDDFLVLIPAFVVSELTAAFQVGFLLYLPFVIIDLIVSNVLLAMGMMMVSPITISMPLKLFLFVMVDGWTRLIQGLVLSYT